MSDVMAEVLVLAVAVIAVCKVIELFRGIRVNPDVKVGKSEENFKKHEEES